MLQIQINDGTISGIVLIGPRPSLNQDTLPSLQEWATVFAETFIAPLEVVRYFGPKLHDNSSIVVISGSSSKNYSSDYANTNVIRLAWSGEIKNLMYFFADRKMRVNSISPGIVLTQHHEDRIRAQAISNNISYKAQLSQDTSAIPLKSYATKEDVANLAIFLLSNKASSLNGINVLLDGGESSAY
ncbi:SDR family oxidoreductase [Rickettsia amblyommatis]|uniref:SDR family oxidoreductase n=1 Tax=Rickettsia amblyommatis TaxID=33989 RepID=UPI0009C05383|nr:SDR family oxidoreductase [Rickettsia amblyommatis]